MVAPKSPYGLIQEEFQHDPWKVFVVCIFCNLTRRTASEPYMREFFARWPTAGDTSNADQGEISDLIKTLGLADRRAKTLVRMSQDYLVKAWQTDPRVLYGIGEYAHAAYQIFCQHQWAQIPEPKDGALKKYWKWINNVE
jgi:methyl-CpG-binding domain protein 4